MNFLRRLKEYFLSLNIFSNDTETNLFELRIGRVATRIYLFIFIILILIYIIFNAITTEMKSITIYNPSENEFEDLQNRYSNSLVCPCRNIVISYESFVNIIPTIHEICLSGFIKNEWISYITNTIDYSDLIQVRFIFIYF